MKRNYKDWLIITGVVIVILAGLWALADNYRTLFRYLLDGELYVGAGMLTVTLITSVGGVCYILVDIIKSWIKK